MEHRRPKAGDAPHKGLLKVKKRGLRCLGFSVWGLGFRVPGFRVQGSGFRVGGDGGHKKKKKFRRKGKKGIGQSGSSQILAKVELARVQGWGDGGHKK